MAGVDAALEEVFATVAAGGEGAAPIAAAPFSDWGRPPAARGQVPEPARWPDAHLAKRLVLCQHAGESAADFAARAAARTEDYARGREPIAPGGCEGAPVNLLESTAGWLQLETPIFVRVFDPARATRAGAEGAPPLGLAAEIARAVAGARPGAAAAYDETAAGWWRGAVRAVVYTEVLPQHAHARPREVSNSREAFPPCDMCLGASHSGLGIAASCLTMPAAPYGEWVRGAPVADPPNPWPLLQHPPPREVLVFPAAAVLPGEPLRDAAVRALLWGAARGGSWCGGACEGCGVRPLLSRTGTVREYFPGLATRVVELPAVARSELFSPEYADEPARRRKSEHPAPAPEIEPWGWITPDETAAGWIAPGAPVAGWITPGAPVAGPVAIAHGYASALRADGLFLVEEPRAAPPWPAERGPAACKECGALPPWLVVRPGEAGAVCPRCAAMIDPFRTDAIPLVHADAFAMVSAAQAGASIYTEMVWTGIGAAWSPAAGRADAHDPYRAAWGASGAMLVREISPADAAAAAPLAPPFSGRVPWVCDEYRPGAPPPVAGIDRRRQLWKTFAVAGHERSAASAGGRCARDRPRGRLEQRARAVLALCTRPDARLLAIGAGAAEVVPAVWLQRANAVVVVGRRLLAALLCSAPALAAAIPPEALVRLRVLFVPLS
jgi:hypothetical protein